MSRNRLGVCAAGLVAVALVGAHAGRAPVTADIEQVPALRSLGSKVGLTLGAAVRAEPLETDRTYAQLAARHFHIFTPENALKWGHVEHQKGRRDTRSFDVIARFAAENGATLRGHTLVWDLEIPSWVDMDARSSLEPSLHAHIRSTMRENHRRVMVWDVVNEALDAEGHRKPTVFQERMGSEYIGASFRLARSEAPDAKLFYNDFAVLWPGPKADGLLRLVDSLQAEGVPIDGVGLQSHLHLVPEGRLDWKAIRENLRRLGQRGLEVHLTEVDVRVADLAGGQQGRLLAQAHAVYELVDACMHESACTTVSFWGISDRDSWVDRTIGPDDPLLWDEQYAPKPACLAVVDALRKQPWRGCSENVLAKQWSDRSREGIVTGGRVAFHDGPEGNGPSSWLAVMERTETWHGPQIDLSKWVSEGMDYRLTAQFRAGRGVGVRGTLRIVDGQGTRYVPLSHHSATGEWQDYSVAISVALEPPVRGIHWYLEGPPPGTELALGAVSLTADCPAMDAAGGA